MLAPIQAHLLSLLRQCRAVHLVKQIHSLLISSGYSQEASATIEILGVAALSLPGDIAYASLVFRRITAPSASIWNTMLRGYSLRPNHEEEAAAHYADMRRSGVAPTKHTYPLLLKALCKSGNRDPYHIHSQILKFGFDSDPFVQNSLVSVYANVGDLRSAYKVFDEMPLKDSVSWTSLVHGYVKNNRESQGLTVFAAMKSSGVEIDEVVVVTALNGTGVIGNVWLGRCIHGFYVECGRVRWDVYVGSAIVDMYAKCGYGDDARRVFEEMPCKNVVSWSALIAGYVQCDRLKDALSLFQDMLVEGVKLNQVTLASVLAACAQLGALDQGRWVHRYIERKKMVLNSVIGTALINMYAKCGCVDDALTVFHGLSQKNVYTWTALISGLAMHGLVIECLESFSRMIEERVQPNEVTFVGILAACSHSGLVHEGRTYFDCMIKDYEIEPKLEHYGCLVDLLGRAGHLEEALHCIEIMPMEPSAGVWGALFNACMIHKDFLLAEMVGKCLLRVQPNHSGRYALLANVYSLSKKWEEAAHVRMAMRERKVDKTPGCSWIEVNGGLNEFIALDESHSQCKVIYETLHGITMLMKLERYVSDSCLLFLELDV